MQAEILPRACYGSSKWPKRSLTITVTIFPQVAILAIWNNCNAKKLWLWCYGYSNGSKWPVTTTVTMFDLRTEYYTQIKGTKRPFDFPIGLIFSLSASNKKLGNKMTVNKYNLFPKMFDFWFMQFWLFVHKVWRNHTLFVCCRDNVRKTIFWI